MKNKQKMMPKLKIKNYFVEKFLDKDEKYFIRNIEQNF